MDHGSAMRVVESVRDLVKPSLHYVGRKLPLVPAGLAQRASGKISHHKVEESFIPAVVVDVDEVGMTKPTDGAGFPEEALLELRADHQTWREHFYGNGPTQRVLCEEYLTHPADTQAALYGVASRRSFSKSIFEALPIGTVSNVTQGQRSRGKGSSYREGTDVPPGTVGVGAWLRVWLLDEDATSFVFVTSGTEAGDTGGLPVMQIEIVLSWFEELRQRMGSN